MLDQFVKPFKSFPEAKVNHLKHDVISALEEETLDRIIFRVGCDHLPSKGKVKKNSGKSSHYQKVASSLDDRRWKRGRELFLTEVLITQYLKIAIAIVEKPWKTLDITVKYAALLH